MGEIDCWEVECPPVWCESTILSTSDCCPRCPFEPTCNSSSSSCRAGPGLPGRYFQPKPWSDINTCSSCNCKVRRWESVGEEMAERVPVILY
ncbi:unnamed protein product [Nesidiocoris tenuis]|uniref:VWFC domain-containing protein n=1 Tax=Nesidiocoris tenuis TaxID=355587 RepID=A0A6H5G3F9_9HEMI|nr:unnamed protein product [Nesidiocoris tenuis]CAA9997311.1 unnamed protein product [Nesidiocoris tenuis]